jgi:hypothetical protein
MMRVLVRGALVALAVAVLAGCASTPQATPERDAEAKRFMPVSGEGTLYVYRPDFAGLHQNDPAIYVDGRLIGTLLPGTFFRITARPGTRLINGYAHDDGSIKVDARAGELHFVSVHVIADQSRYERPSPEAARRDIVRCCALLENWAPGQRPLLH